ncbi:thiamine pyrophosphate-binding protein [Rhodovulum sp. DZ06]|uniref:thiamine pyrophosphate-binding protein n=1 Tax=Rhodovulum sp. DZ06 TaxID=3425126 RepID=UPI003D3285B0
MPTAADLIARRLHAAGARHVFGMPGGEVLTLLDALTRAGLAFTLCRHENSGAFMAEGAHHATGAPGVLLATIGPGVLNAVNAAANALQDQVPLLILSGRVDGAEAQRYTHQVVDQAGALAAVTKASVRLEPGAVQVQVDRAVRLALQDPPGPVHLDLPVTLAGAEEPEAPALLTPAAAPAAPAPGEMLEAARARIRAARRPVMLAGVGALHHGAEAEIARLCRARAIPLLTTYKAKGILPESDPLALGGHGLSPASDELVMPFLAEADLVLLAGYDPVEMRPGWRAPWAPGAAIEVAHIPPAHGMHSASMAFVGDVGAGLRALFDGAAPRTEWGEAPAQLRAALKARFEGPASWGPHAAFRALRRALPPAAVVTADSGAHRILLSQMWEAPAPRRLLQSSGFCTMGCALGLAAGYAAAAPDTPVCAVIGDGGLEMTAGELATLRDLGRPALVLVLADASLALIEKKQAAMGLPREGVRMGETDYPALARAFGGHGAWIDDEAALEAEARAALDRDGFTLLAARIEAADYDGAF